MGSGWFCQLSNCPGRDGARAARDATETCPLGCPLGKGLRRCDFVNSLTSFNH